MLIQCTECSRQVSDQASACPHCGCPLQAAAGPEQSSRRPTALFLTLAAIAFGASLFAPRILVFFPVMLTLGLLATSLVRRERGRLIALGIGVLSIAVLFWSSSNPSEGSNLDAAEVVDWNWERDPDFGTDGTVKWRVVVRNLSDRPISSARVEFTTYDASGGLLDSTFTFVDAIPPGESRSDDSYADFYGSETRAQVKLTNVRFAADG